MSPIRRAATAGTARTKPRDTAPRMLALRRLRRRGSAKAHHRFGIHLSVASHKKVSFYADAGRCTLMHANRNGSNDLSGSGIGCAFTVLNTLAVGLLEQVHEHALAHKLRKT